MQKNSIKLLLLFGILGSIQCREFADQSMEINVGPTFNFARYTFGCLPKIQGYLTGVHVDLRHSTPSCLYANLRFDGRWNAGFVCGCLDLKSRIKDYRPELNLGYNFYFCDDSIRFTPLVGVGGLFLSNRLEPQCIEYNYRNVTVPIGFNVCWDRDPEDSFDFELQFLYRIDARTRVKLDMPCIEICDPVCLKRTHGFLVEMPLRWYYTTDCNMNWQIKVVPYFDWNNFGSANEANCNGLCFEIPSLKQWYLGLHLDFGIRF